MVRRSSLRLPGNHTLPGAQSPAAAGIGPAGTKTGTGNTGTFPGDHALPGAPTGLFNDQIL
jgi:hypothetical protein